MASTHLTDGRLASRDLSRLASLSIAGVTWFAVAIVALHALRPDLDPIVYATSQYAVGPYGWLMSSAFFSMSLASFALALGLARGVPAPARSRSGINLLCIWATGVLIAMMFPLDPVGVPPTLSHTIHQGTAPFTFLSLAVGMFLVSWRFKHDQHWMPLHRTALILSLIVLAAFVATFITFISGSAIFGLVQRITLAVAATWLLLTATRLRSESTGDRHR
jgi:hypothetical protein